MGSKEGSVIFGEGKGVTKRYGTTRRGAKGAVVSLWGSDGGSIVVDDESEGAWKG